MALCSFIIILSILAYVLDLYQPQFPQGPLNLAHCANYLWKETHSHNHQFHPVLKSSWASPDRAPFPDERWGNPLSSLTYGIVWAHRSSSDHIRPSSSRHMTWTWSRCCWVVSLSSLSNTNSFVRVFPISKCSKITSYGSIVRAATVLSAAMFLHHGKNGEMKEMKVLCATYSPLW